MKKISKKGLSMVEIVLAIALFSFNVLGLMELFGQSQNTFQKNALLRLDFEAFKRDLYTSSLLLLENFNGTNTAAALITKIDDFSKEITVIGSSSKNSVIERITDWHHAFGTTNCDSTKGNGWKRITATGSLNLEKGNIATSLYARGNYVYLTADSATRSAKDFFIVDVSDKNNPLIISSLDTGPGALSVAVAGNYAYIGNSSISAQLQVIDIQDPANPKLVFSTRLSGTYSDETTVPIALFYYDSKLYLGTKKSQSSEFRIFDVFDPLNVKQVGQYEMGTQINSIFVKENLAYITSPDDNELQVLDVSNPAIIKVFSSFNAAGGSGNGKSFVLKDQNAFLGRTKGGGAEIYALNTSDLRHITAYSMNTIGASINALIVKEDLFFLITPKTGDNFQVWDIHDPAHMQKVSNNFLIFSATPTAMSCNKDTLYIALQSSDALKIVTEMP